MVITISKNTLLIKIEEGEKLIEDKLIPYSHNNKLFNIQQVSHEYKNHIIKNYKNTENIKVFIVNKNDIKELYNKFPNTLFATSEMEAFDLISLEQIYKEIITDIE